MPEAAADPPRRVTVRCAVQDPHPCTTATSWVRHPGAHTLAVRGNRLLSSGEALDLREKGWRVRNLSNGQSTAHRWTCPQHSNLEP
jgi:hypothetical protein